jgi:hypothetical protein
MPLISAIFVFHRHTPYLRPALQSLLAQTQPDFEVIVVDNGTGLGLGAFGDDGRDPRLRLLSFPQNRGIAAAHNAAVALAQSEFIALMDYDDVALPRRFACQVAAMQAKPQLGLVFGHALEIDGADKPLVPAFTLATTREQYEFSAYAMPAISPTTFGRREVFARVPQREEFLAASDFDFTSRALEQWPSESVPEVVLKYRRYSTQTTVQQYALQQFKVSITRLLTARRRAGRPEGLPELLADLAEWRSPVPVPAEYFSWFAERAQREGFPLLAVYFARRLLSVRRTPGTMLTAWRLTAAALRSAPSQRVKLLRMFFTGPLRTHGLRRL